MKNIYLNENSDYLGMTGNWHSEDSEWKANLVLRMLERHNIIPDRVVEVGCGVGKILYYLNNSLSNLSISYEGYDIAEDAIKLASRNTQSNVSYFCSDFLKTENSNYDLILMMDVFEHVEDYLGFLKNCSLKGRYKLYHIPLELHISSILRNKLIRSRKLVGHIHYFSKETALASIEDTGQTVKDYCYTKSAEQTCKGRFRIINVIRKLCFAIMPDLTVKVLGGYSLLALAE